MTSVESRMMSEIYKTVLTRIQQLEKPGPMADLAERAEFWFRLIVLQLSISSQIDDPWDGVLTIAEFFKADRYIFQMGHGIAGLMRSFFRVSGRDYFVGYASRCSDKLALTNLILELTQDDPFAVRVYLFDCMAKFLPPALCRSVTDTLWQRAMSCQDKSSRAHWLEPIKTAAIELIDPQLYEKACRAVDGLLTYDELFILGDLHFSCGDLQRALFFLTQVDMTEVKLDDDCLDYLDRILVQIYAGLDDYESTCEIARRLFRRHRSLARLKEYLDVIGHEHLEPIVAEEVQAISQSTDARVSDLEFLVVANRLEEAEQYLILHGANLKGRRRVLFPLSIVLTARLQCLSATILLRILLEQALRRSNRSHRNALDYLKLLDELAEGVSNWQGVTNHIRYKKELQQQYCRRAAFWQDYGSRPA
jgi:hypothetical protein